MNRGRHEFRNLRWVSDKIPAILIIKDYFRCTSIEARDNFNKLDSFINESIYVIDEDSTWDDRNYSVFLKYLKKHNIIDFEWFDFIEEAEKERVEKEREEYLKAQEWLKTLTPEEQSMVQVLISGSMLIVCG